MNGFEYRCGRGHSPVEMVVEDEGRTADGRTDDGRTADGTNDDRLRLYRCPVCARESWVEFGPDGSVSVVERER